MFLCFKKYNLALFPHKKNKPFINIKTVYKKIKIKNNKNKKFYFQNVHHVSTIVKAKLLFLATLSLTLSQLSLCL